ncbi:IclR family transcriptional regulator [Gordonia humi]|uniref:IclR family transcriptional regulator n=1 Tax=Gordonia humi TaxID=686429 RepID=UPI003615B3F7
MGSEVERPVPNNGTHRITTLLALIGRTEGGIGPREASRITGIDRSAISRIFNQLELLGWVQEVGERGTYTVGPEMFSVAAAVRERDSLGRAARPLLEMLTDRFDETSYLAVRHADHLIFEDRVDCTQRLRYVVEINEPFPIMTGAAGRAILSALPRDEATQLIASALPSAVSSTTADFEEYQSELNRDRSLGYAYSRGGKMGSRRGSDCLARLQRSWQLHRGTSYKCANR